MDEPLALAIALLECLDSEAKVKLLREIFRLWPELEKRLTDSREDPNHED
jgi:hypothetical protein